MFTQRVSLTNQSARTVSATPLHKLGTICETADGRGFRYCSAGAVNLAAGKVNVAPAAVANHTNVAVAVAAAVGSKQVSVTVGATAVTLGQYDGGYLVVVDVAGQGAAYRIAGTPAIASSGTGVIQLEEAVATALTTSSKVNLQPSLWGNVIVHPGGSSAFFTNGSNNIAVPAGNYYWSQTMGVTSVLSDGIITKGAGAVLTANAVPGAVTVEAATAVTQRVGTAVEATVDTKYYPVYLTLE